MYSIVVKVSNDHTQINVQISFCKITQIKFITTHALNLKCQVNGSLYYINYINMDLIFLTVNKKTYCQSCTQSQLLNTTSRKCECPEAFRATTMVNIVFFFTCNHADTNYKHKAFTVQVTAKQKLLTWQQYGQHFHFNLRSLWPEVSLKQLIIFSHLYS